VDGIRESGLGAEYTKAAGFFAIEPVLNFI
jgi:hypothetical protein